MNKKTKMIVVTLLSVLLLVGIFFGINYVIYKNGKDSLIWKVEKKEETKDKKKKQNKDKEELKSEDQESATNIEEEQKENNKNDDNSKSQISTNSNTTSTNNNSSSKTTNNTAKNNSSSSSNNSNSKPNNSSSNVSKPSQNTNTQPACKPKQFDMSWFRADFSSLSQCQAKGNTYMPKYGFYCDNAQDDCGTTWYMLILSDENGTYDWHTIQ